MIIGSAEEDENTLQFYQMVFPILFRLITSMSWSTPRMRSTLGSSALAEVIVEWMVD